MVKLLFFWFRVTNSRLNNRKFTSSYLPDWCTFIFLLSSYKREVAKWKIFLEYYSLNVCGPLEINTTSRFLKSSCNSMSWGCPGIHKSRSDMDLVSNIWKFIRSFFIGYIALDFREIRIQSFEMWLTAA